MLSIEESRKILGEEFAGMTDKEVEALRNGYYQIINGILDEYELEEKKKGSSK